MDIEGFQNRLTDTKRLHAAGEHDRAWASFEQLKMQAVPEFGVPMFLLQQSTVFRAQAIALRREKKFEAALGADMQAILHRAEYSWRDSHGLPYTWNYNIKELQSKLPGICKKNKAPELASAYLGAILDAVKKSNGFLVWQEVKGQAG